MVQKASSLFPDPIVAIYLYGKKIQKLSLNGWRETNTAWLVGHILRFNLVNCFEKKIVYQFWDEIFLQVNRLEPHPHIPVLATSGLDHDVKIWVPSCEEPPSMTNLETVISPPFLYSFFVNAILDIVYLWFLYFQCVSENMKSRERDISREPNPFDGQLLWFLWRHARQSEVPRVSRNFSFNIYFQSPCFYH